MNTRGDMMKFDKYSYYLGMTFAFVECVSNDAKEIALTHPLSYEEFKVLKEYNEKIVFENQLHLYWDTIHNKTIGVIYKYEESIIKYVALRKHFNVIENFDKFKDLLGYNIVSKMNEYPKIETNIIQSEDWLLAHNNQQ